MFGRRTGGPFGEAAWTVKCCFYGTCVPQKQYFDAGCAIFYFICWLVAFFT